MKVLGWASDTSACGFYRIEEPFRAVNAAGLAECEHSLTWSGVQLEEADVVVAQRVAQWHPLAILVELQRRGVPWIYELDDDLLQLDPKNPAAGFYHSADVQKCIRHALWNANWLIASTDELAEQMAIEARRPITDFVVRPNLLPAYWRDLSAAVAEKLDEEPELRLLWAGSATHAEDLANSGARYGVVRLLRERPAVKMMYMGFDFSRQLGVKGELIPWRDKVPAYHRSLAATGATVGLCPLVKTRFNRAKSWLKAIEYQAAGIIPVATDTPQYARAIEHGVTGFLCRTQTDWRNALRELADDPARVAEMRQACLSLTQSRIIDEAAGEWLDAFQRPSLKPATQPS